MKDGRLQETRPMSGRENESKILLIRNRDLNGNGYLDEEELRWYVPAIGHWWVCGWESLPWEKRLLCGNCLSSI